MSSVNGNVMKGQVHMKSIINQMIVVLAAVALAGCVPGEATIKISAKNVRRVLEGEVVKVPVHGEVKSEVPMAMWMKEQKCPVCEGPGPDLTNALEMADRKMRAAAQVMTLLLADGSCVTGGVKVVGTNVVYWANLDTKFLFGTEEAILAASNKVKRCNGAFVLNDKGEIDLAPYKRMGMKLQKIERIFKVLESVSKGCECCKGVYDGIAVMVILGIAEYDSVTVVVKGDGKGGFSVETDGKCVGAEKIRKGLRCVIRSRDSDKKGKERVSVKLYR